MANQSLVECALCCERDLEWEVFDWWRTMRSSMVQWPLRRSRCRLPIDDVLVASLRCDNESLRSLACDAVDNDVWLPLPTPHRRSGAYGDGAGDGLADDDREQEDTPDELFGRFLASTWADARRCGWHSSETLSSPALTLHRDAVEHEWIDADRFRWVTQELWSTLGHESMSIGRVGGARGHSDAVRRSTFSLDWNRPMKSAMENVAVSVAVDAVEGCGGWYTSRRTFSRRSIASSASGWHSSGLVSEMEAQELSEGYRGL